MACQNSKDLKLVQIPSGKCTILETEVAQEVYKSVMGENPSFFKGENFPAVNVSWYDAIYFLPLRFIKGGSVLDDSERYSPDFSYVFVPSQELSYVSFRIVRNCEQTK